MAAMGISWNGTTPIYIVPSEVRLNAQAFIKLVLAPMIRYDFPRLYGDRAKEVIFHMDNAPAHTAKATVQWMKDHHVNWIPSVHWMANSPNLAPMDYAINSNFKVNHYIFHPASFHLFPSRLIAAWQTLLKRHWPISDKHLIRAVSLVTGNSLTE